MGFLLSQQKQVTVFLQKNKTMSNIEQTMKFESYEYSDQNGAFETISLLRLQVKEQMARVYKEAFEGYPWYEVYQCRDCENYSPQNDVCRYCEGSNFSEAYPIEWLVKDYIPEMLASFTPGVLIISENSDDVVEGFSTGGGITVADLINKKYAKNQAVLNSILQNTALTPETVVFYENETCVSPDSQQKGLGGELNKQRLQGANAQEFDYICGRTINLPWLKLKERQMNELGFDFVSFVPAGDTYEINGQKRFFFIGSKRKQS